MPSQPITVDKLRELINKGEAKDPLVFLESLMTGQDPRRLSDVYKLVLDIQDFSDGEPSSEDWAEVVDLVMERYKYHSVSMSESANAAKTLAEYLHAKRKNVEITGADSANGRASEPLTEEEIELFKEKFNDEF